MGVAAWVGLLFVGLLVVLPKFEVSSAKTSPGVSGCVWSRDRSEEAQRMPTKGVEILEPDTVWVPQPGQLE